MRTVRWAGPARRDITRIGEYRAAHEQTLFPKLVAAIVATGTAIAKAPKHSAFVGSTFVRKWRVKRLPYLIFYQIEDDYIHIPRVRHVAEDWSSDY